MPFLRESVLEWIEAGPCVSLQCKDYVDFTRLLRLSLVLKFSKLPIYSETPCRSVGSSYSVIFIWKIYLTLS